jgi:18S rRNA (adenine1779-N6/adenine1780-N6)-dimethyltransferase
MMALDGAGGAGNAGDVDAAAVAAANPSRRSKRKVSPEFKDLMMAVLEGAGLAQARPAKMSQDDFLRLLAAFNAAGVHFS